MNHHQVSYAACLSTQFSVLLSSKLQAAVLVLLLQLLAYRPRTPPFRVRRLSA